jgi:hypothetical protein
MRPLTEQKENIFRCGGLAAATKNNLLFELWSGPLVPVVSAETANEKWNRLCFPEPAPPHITILTNRGRFCGGMAAAKTPPGPYPKRPVM